MTLSRTRAPHWGEPRAGLLARIRDRLATMLGARPTSPRHGLPPLPVALRRTELAAPYLAAEQEGDHRRAGAAALQAMERGIVDEDWWPADTWGHRALWHFERADQALQAARVARRIGDLRTAAGDPGSARRYYAEAISEARDIGAEREEGLAALGLGRAALELGDVTTSRRLATISLDLLERSSAPQDERHAALALRGSERRVGAGQDPETSGQ
jgi:tetratricopeptide (TPR) repeat protein